MQLLRRWWFGLLWLWSVILSKAVGGKPMPDMPTWVSFAAGLRQAGLRLLAESNVKETNDGKAELKITGLMLLSRTLSNLKAALLLLEKKQIVEARIVARCCYENHLWALGLVRGGRKFKDDMIGDEMRHKRTNMQTLFSSRAALDEDRMAKMRQWMRDTKHWEDADTLSPKGVAKETGDRSYIFYQYFSLDAHPSIHTLNRYFEEAKAAEDSPTIIVEPEVNDAEIVETLNLLCLPVIGVFLGVSHLLGQEEVAPWLYTIAQEYQRLTELSSRS